MTALPGSSGRSVFLPVRMSDYAAVSRQIRAILDDFTPIVEPLSLDEAFLDLFTQFDVKVGVSLDGDRASNDRHRL